MFPALNNALRNLRDSKTPQNLFLSADDDATLDVDQQIVHVTGFSGAVAITLPPVSEVPGRAYVVKVLDDASVNNITVQDQNESRNWSDLACSNASGGKLMVVSDGEEWTVLHNTNFA